MIAIAPKRATTPAYVLRGARWRLREERFFTPFCLAVNAQRRTCSPRSMHAQRWDAIGAVIGMSTLEEGAVEAEARRYLANAALALGYRSATDLEESAGYALTLTMIDRALELAEAAEGHAASARP